MLEKFRNTVISLIFPQEKEQGKTSEVKVEVKQEPMVFMSLYLLGEGFYTYHYRNAKPANFVTWLRKNHVDWSNAHSDLLKQFGKTSFEELVEKVYDICYVKKEDSILNSYLRKWYIQEHGVFHFSVGKRVFVTNRHSHLLLVFYNVEETEVLILGEDKDMVAGLLGAPENYKNNWFIGVEGSDDTAKTIVNYILSAPEHTAVHFKFINDDVSQNSEIVDILKDKGITNYVEPSFNAVTTIPNDATTQARFNRYDQFNDFAREAKDKFQALLKETPEAKRFDDFFTLNVWDDKNHPKNDTTFVYIGFGNRLLNVWHNSTGFTSTTEEGARLSFSRMDTGYVGVFLYPAKTENRKPYEDFVILKHRINPSELSESKVLKHYWEDLIAYMECTSIDGNPTLCQELRIWWLRHSHNMVIDNVHQPTRRSVFWKKVWQFVLTVGLSGFVFYCLQFGYGIIKPDNTQQQYKDELILHIDSLRDAVKESSDSINITISDMRKKLSVQHGGSSGDVRTN